MEHPVPDFHAELARRNEKARPSGRKARACYEAFGLKTTRISRACASGS